MNNQITYNTLIQIFVMLCLATHCLSYMYLHKIHTRTATKIDVARLAICLQLRTTSMAVIICIILVKVISL